MLSFAPDCKVTTAIHSYLKTAVDTNKSRIEFYRHFKELYEGSITFGIWIKAFRTFYENIKMKYGWNAGQYCFLPNEPSKIVEINGQIKWSFFDYDINQKIELDLNSSWQIEAGYQAWKKYPDAPYYCKINQGTFYINHPYYSVSYRKCEASTGGIHIEVTQKNDRTGFCRILVRSPEETRQKKIVKPNLDCKILLRKFPDKADIIFRVKSGKTYFGYKYGRFHAVIRVETSNEENLKNLVVNLNESFTDHKLIKIEFCDGLSDKLQSIVQINEKELHKIFNFNQIKLSKNCLFRFKPNLNDNISNWDVLDHINKMHHEQYLDEDIEASCRQFFGKYFHKSLWDEWKSNNDDNRLRYIPLEILQNLCVMMEENEGIDNEKYRILSLEDKLSSLEWSSESSQFDTQSKWKNKIFNLNSLNVNKIKFGLNNFELKLLPIQLENSLKWKIQYIETELHSDMKDNNTFYNEIQTRLKQQKNNIILFTRPNCPHVYVARNNKVEILFDNNDLLSTHAKFSLGHIKGEYQVIGRCHQGSELYYVVQNIFSPFENTLSILSSDQL